MATVSKSPKASKPKAAKAAKTPPPAPVAAEERDYLVVFEEPDPYGLPSDDVLVLDIDTQRPQRPEVDVQQKLGLELTNTTSRLGTFGFGLTLFGGLVGVGLMVFFASIYPDGWYGHVSTIRTVIITSVVSMILMIAGTMLTHYGRRIQARGQLSDVRIVEKSSQNRVNFE